MEDIFEDLDYEAKQFLKNLNSETNLNIEKDKSFNNSETSSEDEYMLIHLGRDY